MLYVCGIANAHKFDGQNGRDGVSNWPLDNYVMLVLPKCTTLPFLNEDTRRMLNNSPLSDIEKGKWYVPWVLEQVGGSICGSTDLLNKKIGWKSNFFEFFALDQRSVENVNFYLSHDYHSTML